MINYRQGDDLKVKMIVTKSGVVVSPTAVPFDITLWVGAPSNAITAGWSGSAYYGGCSVRDNAIIITLRKPSLPSGKVAGRMTMHYPDTESESGVRDETIALQFEVPDALMAQSGDLEIDAMVSHEVVGIQGAPGQDGQDGQDGVDGVDGAPGIQGMDGSGGGFYNVDSKIPLADGEHYTKETAIAAVAASQQVNTDDKVGMILSYWDADNSKWRNYRYSLEDVTDEDFADPDNWSEFTAGGSGTGGDYTVRITQISNQTQVVSASTTGVNIKYSVSITDDSGVSTGELVNCTISVRQANGDTQSFNRQVSQGVVTQIDLDDYVGVGANTIIVRAIGVTTGTIGQSSFLVTMVSLELSSNFDFSRLQSTLMSVPYVVSGAGAKTVEFYVDGVLKSSDEVLLSSASNTKQLSLSGLSLTRHTLQMRAKVTDATYGTFYSHTLYFDFFVSGAVSGLIGLGVTLGEGVLLAAGTNPTIEGVAQFGSYGYKIAAYNPAGASTDISIYEDQVLKSEVSVGNDTIYEYVNIAKTAGDIAIMLYASDTNYREMTLSVEASGTNLVDITDGLKLDLSAIGRSNSAANKDVWRYTDAAGNTVDTTFSGVPWTSTCGWVQNKYLLLANGGTANIGLQVLTSGDKTAGKTIEIEYMTANVYDTDAVVAGAMTSGDNPYGLEITSHSVRLTSQAGATVETQYKSGTLVRVCMVIHPIDDANRPLLIDLYVNGEHSGCVNYLVSDSFAVQSNLVLGSTAADLYVKSIKVYGKALSDEDILNNYIIDRDDPTELLRLYNTNNILTVTGDIDRTVAINQLPIMILTGDVDTLVELNDKSQKVRVVVEYQEVDDPTKNFIQDNVKLKLQGTSSLTYPRKNFKFTLNEAWPLRANSFPAFVYCLKADFAESSGTHNTGIARLWNAVLLNAGIRTEAQVAYDAYCAANSITGDDKKDVRTTVDGYPILLFWRKTASSGVEFLGKYNFNTDKAAEQTFGFKDIPGFDDDGIIPSECWEFLDNTNPLGLFTTVDGWDTPDEYGVSGWAKAFERRFPDDDTVEDTTELKKVCTWLASVNPLTASTSAERLSRLNTFYTEVSNWFDVTSLCAYYLYTEYFGAVDQRVKNCMLASYGWNAAHTNKIWRFINYDNDTVNGLRNDGLIKYDYLVDENTIDPSINDYAYAGHDSGLWECLRSKLQNELQATAQLITSGDYPLSYANVIEMFNKNQMGKWCERVYNMDGDYKYVQPYLQNGSPYLYALQGSRSAHRQWWLYNRFAILNSKYSCGDFRGNYFSFLAAGAPAGLTFAVKVAVKMYVSWGYNNQVAELSGLLDAGDSYTFTNPVINQIGNVASIYGGAYLSEIDVSNMAQYLTRVDTNNIGDDNNLVKLVLGKSGVSNSGLSVSTFNINNATKLQYLDVQGMTELSGLDLRVHTKLRELYAEGSGIATLALAESAILEVLHLPAGMITLALEGLESLTTAGLTLEGYGSLLTLTVKDTPHVNTQGLVEAWLATAPTLADCSVAINDVAWTGFSEANLIRLIGMGSCTLSGNIALSSLSAANKALLVAKFGDIDSGAGGLTITYPNSCTVEIVSGGTIFGGSGTTVAKVSSVNINSTLGLTETNNTSYFTITGAAPVVDAVNGIISRVFTCVASGFPTNGGAYLQGNAVIGTTISRSASVYVQGTANITITSIYVAQEDGSTPDQVYTTVGTHRFYCLPHCTDGSTDFETTTDDYEIAFGININSGTVYESCTVDILNSGDDEIYVLKKNGIELARVPKYANKNDKTLPYCDLVVSRTVNEFDEDAIGGDINAFLACGLNVTNRTTGLVNFGDNMGLIVHQEYYAIQSYNELLPNYNPAVAIILYNNKASLPFGSSLDNQMINNNITGEHGLYITMAQAEMLTALKGYFVAQTTVIDTYGIVTESYTNNIVNTSATYDFDNFDEFRFFKNIRLDINPGGAPVINGSYCNSFGNCSKLKSIRLSPNVTQLGGSSGANDIHGMFQGCSALNVPVSYFDNIKIIFEMMFWGCSSINWETLPYSLEKIYDERYGSTFRGTNMSISQFPPYLTNCGNLLSSSSYPILTNLPEGVNFISLNGVVCDTLIIPYTKIGFREVFNIGYLGINMSYATTSVVKFRLHNGVTLNTKCGAISRNNNIVNIILPEGITTINTNAFDASPSLQRVILPASVTNLGTTICNNIGNGQVSIHKYIWLKASTPPIHFETDTENLLKGCNCDLYVGNGISETEDNAILNIYSTATGFTYLYSLGRIRTMYSYFQENPDEVNIINNLYNDLFINI